MERHRATPEPAPDPRVMKMGSKYVHAPADSSRCAFDYRFLQVPTAAMVQPAQPSTSISQPAPSGLAVVIEDVPQSPSLDLKTLNNPLYQRRCLANPLERHRADRRQAGLVEAGRTVRRSADIKEMGAPPHLPRLLYACVGAEGRKNRNVRNPIWTRHTARSRNFRCPGISSTSTVGSHS